MSTRQRRRLHDRRRQHAISTRRARAAVITIAAVAPAILTASAVAADTTTPIGSDLTPAEQAACARGELVLPSGKRCPTPSLPGTPVGSGGGGGTVTSTTPAAPAPPPVPVPTPEPAPAPAPAPSDDGPGGGLAPLQPEPQAPAPAPAPEDPAPEPSPDVGATPSAPQSPTPATPSDGTSTPSPAPETSSGPSITIVPTRPADTPAPYANPDAPAMAPNPAPNTAASGGGVSIGGSYYQGIGGGATLVATPQGNWIVPEIGFGLGPSVTVNAGSNVNVPSVPSAQVGATISEGPLRGSVNGNIPLDASGADPGNWTFTGNAGVNVGNLPTGNVRGSVTWSGNDGLTGGVQYSGTNQMFDVTDQVKAAVRVPIPLPNPTVTLPADQHGVAETVIPTGEGLPVTIAERNVSGLGYPDGKGNTITVNSDGSVTTHTPTGDVTTYGQGYLDQAAGTGPQGTMTQTMIDNLGRKTDGGLTWQGQDGTSITRDASGTLTQTNPDGTVVTQDASGGLTRTNPDGSTVKVAPDGAVTTSDGSWFGSSTTFNPNGTVSRNDFGGTTVWDKDGAGLSSSWWTGGFPFDAGEAAPTKPADLPSPLSLPHDPNAPAPAPTSSSTTDPFDAGSLGTAQDFGLDFGGFNAGRIGTTPSIFDPNPTDTGLGTTPTFDTGLSDPLGSSFDTGLDSSFDSGLGDSFDSGLGSSFDAGGFDSGGFSDGGGGGW